MPGPTVTWSEGWLWLGGSLLLAILWASLAWFFRRPRPGAVGEAITRLVTWRFSQGLLQVLRLLYYVGVPFAALLWGHEAVVGRLLGLQPLVVRIAGGPELAATLAANWSDWTHDVGWAVALGLGAWGVLALGWWTYRRALGTAGAGGLTAGAHTSGWVFLREAAYHEVHWAFYRNAPILAVGTYWGVWVGLILVALEATLNPAWRASLADPQQAPGRLMRMGLAVASSVLSLLTGNLWLALLLHWGVSWGLASLVRTGTPAEAGPPATLRAGN